MPEESKKVFKASENAKPLTVKRKKKVKPVAEKAAPVDEVPQEQADAEKAIAPVNTQLGTVADIADSKTRQRNAPRNLCHQKMRLSRALQQLRHQKK